MTVVAPSLRPRSISCREHSGSSYSSRSRVCCSALVFVSLAVPQISFSSEQTILHLKADRTQAGVFERIEFRIEGLPDCDNPFDPADLSCDIELCDPHGRTIVLPAFYTQPYVRETVPRGSKPAVWFYPREKPCWLARFAPPTAGRWSARVVAGGHRGTGRSLSVEFEATPSKRRGFVRTASADPYYFQLTTGEPFFAIGQNLAFIGSGQYVDLLRAEQIFGRLQAHGANFVRLWICCQDWAIALEAEKSAWGRSWSPSKNLVRHPDVGESNNRRCIQLSGRSGEAVVVDPSHPVALRPETEYLFSAHLRAAERAAVRIEVNGQGKTTTANSQWQPVSYRFKTGPADRWLGRVRFVLESDATVLIDRVSLREDRADAVELLWEADPNRVVPGIYNLLDAVMIDHLVEAAEQHGIYLQLCVITRDLYMKHLKDPSSDEYRQSIRQAKNLMRYCVARWGYSTHVAVWEYFNEIDPGLPTDDFYREVGNYVAQIDPAARPRTTSTWHPSARDCRHQQLDVAQVHHYLRPTLGESGYDEAAAILHWARFLREHGPRKPGMVAEFGLADDRWGLSPLMKEDEQLHHFRNSLWASALSGTASTSLFWWWEQLDRQDAYPVYKPLADFLSGEPFGLEPFAPIQAECEPEYLRGFGLRGTGRLLLWVFDTRTNWHHTLVEKKPATRVTDATLRLAGLKGTWQTEWWDTRSGKSFGRRPVVADQSGLTLTVPTFERDLAVKCILQKRNSSAHTPK